MHFETLAIHAGMDTDNNEENRPVIPPIYTSTIYEHPESGLDSEKYSYIRHDNPNRKQLETLLTQLESGKAGVAFASGMAAIASVFQALKPGDHVIAPLDVYHGTRKLLAEFMSEWGLVCSFVDMREPDEIVDAIKPKTKLIWIETPSNPMLHITDIEYVCKLARQNDVKVCVDNTWMTPILQQPLTLGADLVMHSTTKYLGGHSDILGGAVICAKDDEFYERIRSIQRLLGSVPSPFDCWLLQRSIRSLPYRMRGHSENAQKIAEFLENHAKVEAVYYPGLKSHEGHDIAAREMSGFGGMISFEYKGSEEAALKVVAKSRLIIRATSLGGVESTWEHRKSSEGALSPTSPRLIRMSVGLEHPDDLIEDIAQSLED